MAIEGSSVSQMRSAKDLQKVKDKVWCYFLSVFGPQIEANVTLSTTYLLIVYPLKHNLIVHLHMHIDLKALMFPKMTVSWKKW